MEITLFWDQFNVIEVETKEKKRNFILMFLNKEKIETPNRKVFYLSKRQYFRSLLKVLPVFFIHSMFMYKI